MKNRPVQGRITVMRYAGKELGTSVVIDESKDHSFIGEILLFVVALATLLRFAIPNYHALVTVRDDTRAQSTFTEAASFLDNSVEPFVLIVDGNSTSKLPNTLSDLEIPSGVILDYVVKVDFPGFFSLKLLSVTHKDGEKRYRLTELDDKRVEQVITK